MKTTKIEKVYYPKKLVDGKAIGKEGDLYVAIPDKGYKGFRIKVFFENGLGTTFTMLIKDWNKADTFRRFRDKWGGKDYTLGYFKCQFTGVFRNETIK